MNKERIAGFWSVQETRKLSPKQILGHEDPAPFLMSFCFDLAALKRSIKATGIVNPPLLTRDHEGRLQVVCGYKRVLAAQELGLDTISCRVVSNNGLPQEQLLLLSLYENLATRTLNIIEKALVLRHLSRFYSPDVIVKRFMAILGLPKRAQVYELYLELERNLNTPIKEALAKGEIQLKTAQLFLIVGGKNAEILFNFGSKLKFTVNQWFQFLDMISDIMANTNCSAKEILDSPEIASVLNRKTSNIPQQANAILDVLRKLRYPHLVLAEEHVKKKIASLHMPEGVRIYFPKGLEDSQYKLEVSFKDGTSLKKKLQELINDASLDNIKSPLFEANTALGK